MAASIDMSLDDIIKKSNSSSSSRCRSRVPPHGPGPDRRFPLRKPAGTTPYHVPQGRQLFHWQGQHPLMVTGMGLGTAAPESGTKLYISSLDYGVTEDDIKLLFSEEGELERYSIHYDKSGRSKGTAEVVFLRKSDALAAMKKYNNMKLDGKPLQIELVGTSLATPAVMPAFQASLLGRPSDGLLKRGRGKFEGNRFQSGFARGRIPGGNGEEKSHIGKVSFRDLDDDLERHRHRLPRVCGEVKGHIGKISARDLDDDLERYHLEGLRINKENGK